MKINFIPTKRFIFLLSLGIIPLLLGGPWVDSFSIFLIYNVILFTLGAMDYFFLASGQVKVGRIIKERFSLGIENAVKITLENKSPFYLLIQVKDDYPQRFNISGHNIFSSSLKEMSKDEISYYLIPLERGIYAFGKIHLRCYSSFGLIGRRRALDRREEVKVYPNIKNISRYQLMSIKGHLHRAGIKSARIPGRSNFESLREYVPDDDYRIINWKATARRGKFIVNQYDDEKSQNIIIMIDAGRLMTGYAGDLSKLDYAVNAALMLAYVCTLKGDKAGMMVFAGNIKTYIPPGRGKKQVNLILETLYDLKPEFVEPNYSLAFKFLGTKIRKRSLLFLFTDCIDLHSSEGLVKYFPTLSPPHLPFCIVLSEPQIEDISGKVCTSSKEIYQQAVAREVLWERKKALAILEKNGVYTLDTAPQNLSIQIVNEYLKIKSMSRL